MATRNFTYDHPAYITPVEHCAGEAGGAATTVYGKYHSFAAKTLKAVHFRVTTAGTHATCGFDVYIGTTSVGQALTGTQAAAVTTSVAVGSAVTSLQAVEVKSLTDATGKAVATYEFVNSPGASFTS